jgi:hypothetical protein
MSQVCVVFVELHVKICIQESGLYLIKDIVFERVSGENLGFHRISLGGSEGNSGINT